MNWKEFFKPTKAKIINFLILAILYSLYMWASAKGCCDMGVDCGDISGHKVPNYYPGSTCCLICATQTEYIFGYLQMIIQSFILPFAVIYLVLSLIDNFFSRKKPEIPVEK